MDRDDRAQLPRTVRLGKFRAMRPSVKIQPLSLNDVAILEAMSTLFGQVFGESQTYCGVHPSRAYLGRPLAGDGFIAIGALDGGSRRSRAL